MPSPPKVDVPKHGGDLAFASARFGSPADGWLDLSTGINPHPYPAPDVDEADLTHLPSSTDLDILLESARKAYQVPEGAGLIATPGTEIAIRLIPLLAPPGKVAVVGPTYASHSEAWMNAGRTLYQATTLDAVPADAAIVIVANPNNPDGRMVSPASLADTARILALRNGLLVVDEAFVDLTPEASLGSRLGDLPAIVLRSFGKFYGLPGLRLGFLAGPEGLADRLGDLLGDWPISGPAISIGRAALSNETWKTTTRGKLRALMVRLRGLLARRGLKVVGGTDLFVLIQTDGAITLHTVLAQRGIWTRVFPEQPDWLRIGLPPDDGFDRLDQALASIRSPTTG